MAHYKAPLRDIQFVRNELLGMDQFYAGTEKWSEVSSDLVTAITDESAKFCENVLAPLNSICQYCKNFRRYLVEREMGP